MWAIETVWGRSTALLYISMIAGLIVCYLFGTIWFVTVYSRQTADIGVAAVLKICVAPFVFPDTIKIILAVRLIQRLMPVTRAE